MLTLFIHILGHFTYLIYTFGARKNVCMTTCMYVHWICPSTIQVVELKDHMQSSVHKFISKYPHFCINKVTIV